MFRALVGQEERGLSELLGHPLHDLARAAARGAEEEFAELARLELVELLPHGEYPKDVCAASDCGLLVGLEPERGVGNEQGLDRGQLPFACRMFKRGSHQNRRLLFVRAVAEELTDNLCTSGTGRVMQRCEPTGVSSVHLPVCEVQQCTNDGDTTRIRSKVNWGFIELVPGIKVGSVAQQERDSVQVS